MNAEHAALLELADHAIVTGANNLTMLLGVEVEFGTPFMLDHEPELGSDVGRLVLVSVSFTEGIEGDTTLAFTSDEAAQMVELMLAGMEYTKDDIFGELGVSALGEAMNQFVAGIGRALGERKGYLVNISTPQVSILEAGTQSLSREVPEVVVGWEGMIGPTPGRLFWTMAPNVVEALVPEAASTATPETAPPAAETPPAQPAVSQSQPAAAPHRTEPSTPLDLGRLADVKLDVSVELGRTRIPIQELLALDEGGVIRLGRRVGEPVDLMVNGLATARGEIVVVDGRLGLRVTELIA